MLQQGQVGQFLIFGAIPVHFGSSMQRQCDGFLYHLQTRAVAEGPRAEQMTAVPTVVLVPTGNREVTRVTSRLGAVTTPSGILSPRLSFTAWLIFCLQPR